jgi:hypothetical protein
MLQALSYPKGKNFLRVARAPLRSTGLLARCEVS